MSQFKTQRLAGGVVLPSGLNLQPRGSIPTLLSTRGPYRAIVVATYVAEDEGNFRKKSIECDVILTKSSLPLFNVPVLQQSHGVHNAELWIPQPSKRTVLLTAIETTTLYDDYDGDLVLLDFIEGSAEHPMILGALTHESAKRQIVRGDGWAESDGGSSRGTPHSEERYSHHRGTEVRVNKNGDFLIDTVGAYGEDDEENPTTDSGQIRLRVKDSLRFTVECDGVDVLEVYKDGTGVHVDIGEGATEKMVLGDKLRAKLAALTVPTSFGNSGTPNNALEFPEFLSAQHRVK